MARVKALEARVDPATELIVGCVMLVVSGWWWFTSHGAVWDGWRTIGATLCVVLGPLLVNRAWKRH